MRRSNLLVAAVALGLCAVAFGLTYRFTVMPAAMVSGMGAAAFPRLVIGVIALLAVLAAFGIGTPPMEKPAPVPPMVWFTALAGIAFLGAVVLVGMWPAAILFMVGLGRLWGERSLWKLAAGALGLCALLYWLFVHFLGGNFPKGLIAQLWS
jgi:hypothetical protein